MHIIECPNCEYENELVNFVSQPGRDAESIICDRCEEPFTFGLDEIIELPDNAAADTQAA